MIRILFAVFLILHGFVHVLYIGQSRGLYELKPGLQWPEGSLAVEPLLGSSRARSLAAVMLGLAAVLFAAAGLALLLGQSWWQPLVVGGAVVSAALYLLMWDGRLQGLDAKGGVGMLLDLALLLIVFVFDWSPLR